MTAQSASQTCDWCTRDRPCKTYSDGTDALVICAECEDAARAANEAPIGGALYRHPQLRGRWRCETAGPKWVLLRSLSVANRGGAWASRRVPRDEWPGRWERA